MLSRGRKYQKFHNLNRAIIPAKNIPRLILIEGFWQIGKSTLAQYLAELFPCVVVEEPNHLLGARHLNNRDAIEKWYQEEHHKRLLAVKKLLQKGKRVLMIRSSLSSRAFNFARNQIEELNSIKNDIKTLVSLKPFTIFLYAPHSFIRKMSKFVNDGVIPDFLMNNTYIKKYEYFFRNYCAFNYGLPISFINVKSDGGDIFIEKRQISTQIFRIIKHNRVGQINCFPFINDNKGIKILLLKRIQSRGGFWQGITGGINVGENIYHALKREIGEEIGIKINNKDIIPLNFTFNYIGKEGYELNEYVFGIKIRTKKINLTLEHELFNFISPSEAIKRIEFSSNKEAIRLLIHKLKRG